MSYMGNRILGNPHEDREANNGRQRRPGIAFELAMLIVEGNTVYSMRRRSLKNKEECSVLQVLFNRRYSVIGLDHWLEVCGVGKNYQSWKVV
jgi:hypothetical protein